MFIVEATNKLNVKRVRKIEKVINGSLSGIIAGIVMGIAVSIANVLNVTAYHSIEIAGGIFIQEVLESPGILWIIVGWLSHLVIAMALGITLCYIYYFTGAGYALLKGLLFGGFTWLLNLGIIAPLINYNIMERLDSGFTFFVWSSFALWYNNSMASNKVWSHLSRGGGRSKR